MTAREEFWARVQDALDRREDPLADPRIAGWLEAHPAEIERYAALVGALRMVACPAARARRWPWWVGVAAAAAAVVMGWWLWPAAPARAELRPAEELGVQVTQIRIEQFASDREGVAIFERNRGSLLRQHDGGSLAPGSVTIHSLRVACTTNTDTRNP